MSSNERVIKFQEDGERLLKSVDVTNIKSMQKVTSEISKLKTWLQKHQNDLLPDQIKGKLFHIIESYYHFSIKNKTNEELLDHTSSLVSDLLQMPEGKLISAKDKKKALNWFYSFNSNNQNSVSENVTEITRWYLEGICEDNSIMLLNVNNEELWKENFHVNNKLTFEEIKDKYESGLTVIIEIDEKTGSILQVIESEN